MVINDKNWVTENTHFLLAYSGINRMKALNKLLQLKMIDYVYENNFLDSSRETYKVAILKRRQTRGISSKSLEIYAVFVVKKRASLLITLSD